MKFRRISGFTLIELLIVMVILGLLASLVAPTMFSKVASSKVKTAQAQMQMLVTSMDAFRLDVGRYPQSLEELRTSNATNWDGPYLPKAVPLDPWGNPYVYLVPGKNGEFDLLTYGADGKQGGEEDNADVSYF
ncbi:TPA: type II secretion system major pseudopilin GspG [Vibrio vulnificus]|uniref:type II secretion system major pseudopilin GspG n=1 Tax=Vibrio vulnificus TaxID=672 RepID=UPI00102337B0|nr:type II secretion system major pseudopilin GspG [Vibrio vulnificus]EIV8467606.1 type II secretion system major pseudopilin GspG [Vibrio vulnificus]EKK9988299.1 type II secretion system major pseudopilin GspG [Vibrio vulnificus]MBN8089477.1 type II secretion system major pseudopilin GspG [Vibrio vulnificus]MBN8118122.1 type II secretion system major pseudopilin GspG [Vibrio vulnificus]RZP54905.1 type II secretion system protein GspG [Vibrio vulnificus]